MLPIQCSFFDKCTDVAPKTKKLDFDDLLTQYFSEHDHRKEKDGPMISPAVFKPRMTRAKNAVQSVSMGMFDFDNVDPATVRETLVAFGIRAILVSTHSHTPEKPSFRAVMPFTEPVAAGHWPKLFAQFDGLFDGAIDPSTKPACQAFYLPSCPLKHKAHAFIWKIDGEVFDPASVLDELDDDEYKDDQGTRAGIPTGSGGKECPRKLAETVLRNMFNGRLKYFNYQFYAYEHGYWKPQNRKVDIERRIMDSHRSLNIGVVKQIVENLDSLTIVTDISPERADGGRYLCLNNGTLDLKSGTLLDHSPEHNLINKMDVDWNPAAKAPIFMSALRDIFKMDDDRDTRIQFIQEWFGYCLIPDTSQHKFLWFVGSGGNGKSVLLNTLAALVGRESVSYAMLERMGEPPVRAELQGKLINISHEMSANATIADGYLKAYVAGDWVEAARKFQPSFSYQPYARFSAATNVLPYLKDTSDGFFRRAIILELTRKFSEDEMDKHLQTKILAEMDGILVWAVQGLINLLERDSFIIPESATKAANKYRDESDSVRYFVKEACTQDKKGTKPATLYEQYQRFATRFRFPMLNLIKFGKQLNVLGIDSRDSNGSKYWNLIADEDYQTESYNRASLADAMN